MVAVGALLIWAGGLWFHIGAILVAAGMVWELARMVVPAKPEVAWQMAGAGLLALTIATYVPPYVALPLLLAPSMVSLSLVPSKRTMFMSYCAVILIAAFGMIQIRDELGFGWLLWLVAVVVATDVMGYFAGRFIGGPKFWPRVSPKKTWSGTIAGWVGAAIVGLLFGGISDVGGQLAFISIAVSMASQMGDIAESAIKRKVGVKDSSHLIPGHGGLLDRFDGMLGGALFLLLAGPLVGILPGLG
ncbi:phosphatidate cytidylyltransferase [Pseudooceanicola sp. LIPI14-2-Ac024]|uniref:phosphatidate cytidylyltransferase n=1 Tax=Pseudooceanicola sp. LIPI14-2-Ac024 TaxID=3344875 RepID=UPI0035D0544B